MASEKSTPNANGERLFWFIGRKDSIAPRSTLHHLREEIGASGLTSKKQHHGAGEFERLNLRGLYLIESAPCKAWTGFVTSMPFVDNSSTVAFHHVEFLHRDALEWLCLARYLQMRFR